MSSAHSSSLGTAAQVATPGTALAWGLAVRPWSFTISLAPILAGTSLAALDGHPAQIALVTAALLASIFIHAGTNLQNDVGDFKRGADRSGRLGPPRATTEGWLTARQVQTAATLCFALAFAPGVYLVAMGGWPIIAIGAASVAAGAAYTAGPRPIAYSGWGEFFVFVFFGLVAVCGMYYLHAGTVGIAPLVAGAAIGLHSSAVLVVNNLRDIDSDRRIGKNTLAVRCGRVFTVWEYAFLMHLPFALAAAMALYHARALFLAPLLLLPWTLRLVARVGRRPEGAWLNGALAATAKLGLAFAVLLSLAAALAR
ncbi:MAG TPA: 1,4-dihydroxy-2-naphthoate octaprenyltransferase [Burkholderiales bacterium]|nr:1,4-dihydroxy-2-naphthoate octaprenyltransferase [Burkholderiales bacterium]